MDLDINNYGIDELLKIFHINIRAFEIDRLDLKILNSQLESKLDKLKEASVDEIDNKTLLIDFFYKSYLKLQAAAKKNDVKAQDGHFLINHKENKNSETFNLNFKSGLINPLTIKTLKKIININTRFRENYNNTSPTDFTINLPYTLKKVLKMRVINYQLPNTVYTVSCKLGSNCFFINDQLVALLDGSYETSSIVEEINSRLADLHLNIEVEFLETMGKMQFASLDDSVFTMKFDFICENMDLNCNLANNINKAQLTLGWLLGFRGTYNDRFVKDTHANFIYSGCNTYLSESIYDDFGNNYFLLSVNDYQNNHDTLFMSPFKFQSLSDNNILAKLSTSCNSNANSKIEYPARIYFGPTDINKLHIKIYDEFGRIIDVNNADLNIELECEILYDL